MASRPVVAAGGMSLIAIILTVAAPQIAKYEGTRYTAYRDITGVLTVCDGHTGRDIKPKTVYTPKECTAMLDQDVTKAAEGVLAVSPELKDHPYTLAAAISFSYNVGLGTYDKSSVRKSFHVGNFKQGCTDLLKYAYAGGKYSDGLYNRRKEEYAICMKGL